MSALILKPLPGILPENRLAAAFVSDFTRVAGLFRFDPACPESFRERAAYLNRSWKGDRRKLASVLEAYNRSLGAGDPVLANARRLGQDGTLAVITGQQAGVLTGPLYAIYKAVTAISLARIWEARLGQPVVPVFWVASEDHDYREVAGLSLLNREGGLQKLVLELGSDYRPAGRVPAGDLPPGAQAAGLVNQFFEALTPGPPNDRMRDLVLTELSGSRTLSQWFARLMTRLFAGAGLVLVDPMDYEIRRMQAPVFIRALESAPDPAPHLERALERVRSLGFETTVEVKPGATCLFIYKDGERRLLWQEGDVFFNRGSGDNWTRQDLISLARSQPWSFSPNVVLRPLTQDCVFPTLAYAAGPGEVAYFSLLAPVYKVMGLEPPVIFPRASLTIVPPAAARQLDKEGISPEEVFGGLKERREQALRRGDPAGFFEALEEFRSAVGAGHAKISELAKALEPSLEFIARDNLNQILAQIGRLEEKARQAARKRSEVSLKRLEAISVALRPAGQFQERVMNVFQYLVLPAAPGAELIPGLIEALNPEDFRHQLVFWRSPN